MSQYLSHIAALALKRVEPVLPRLSSRFEAPLEMAHPADLDFVHESVDLKPKQASLDKAVVDRPVASVGVDEPSNKISKIPEQPVEIKHVKAHKPEPSADEPSLVWDNHLPMESAQSIEQPFMQAPLAIHSEAPLKQRTQIERVQERFTEHTQSERVIREMARFQPNPAIIQFEEPKQALIIKPASIELRHQASGSDSDRPNRFEPGQNQPLQSGEESAQTRTVQVSIGRIEIRANPADKPTAKPRAASSSMSLDDYLKQRGRGKI